MGKVTVVSFGKTTDADWVRVVQYLKKLKQKKKGLEIIAVSLDDKEAPLKKMAKKYKLSFPVVISDDPEVKKYGASVSGTIMLFGTDSKLILRQDKLKDAEHKAFEKKVDKALKAK